MKLSSLIRKIANYSPLNSQESWDFSGYQTGCKNSDNDVKRVFLALDFTEECLDSAKKFKPDLILTHHPFFFGPKNEIILSDPKKQKLENDIYSNLKCPLYSYHTCFDNAPYGMNYTLLKELGFINIHKDDLSFVWLAELQSPLQYDELVRKIRDYTSYSYLLGMKNSNKLIKKVAFVAGSGSSEFKRAIDLHVDCFITGDCPHHRRLDMRRYCLNYIDVPHEIEEIGFLLGMDKILKMIDQNIIVKKYYFERPFDIWR